MTKINNNFLNYWATISAFAFVASPFVSKKIFKGKFPLYAGISFFGSIMAPITFAKLYKQCPDSRINFSKLKNKNQD